VRYVFPDLLVTANVADVMRSYVIRKIRESSGEAAKFFRVRRGIKLFTANYHSQETTYSHHTPNYSR
jgi:hypothetical protein